MGKAQLSKPLPANIWIEMSRIIQPGVVGVVLEIDYKASPLRRDPFFDFIEEFLGQAGPEEPSEEVSRPIGTGFIIDKAGHIVTNYHVIQALDDPRLKARLHVRIHQQKKLYEVEILGRDQRGDIALLKLKKPPQNLTPLELGNSDNLQVGEYVAAFGNPYGHSNSMTVGIISAKGRAIKELNRFPFIQTDASINPGNSGGPLLNTKGYVIAVNTAIDARAQGIGFAIPSNYVKKIISIMKSGGTIERGFLGIGYNPFTPLMAARVGASKSGVFVAQLNKGYPAAQAGIKEKDIIYEFNGKAVRSSEQFANLVQDTKVGKPISVKVLRPTKDRFQELSFTVTLTNAPGKGGTIRKSDLNFDNEQMAPYNIGFKMVSGTSNIRAKFNIDPKAPYGPIVSHIRSGSQANVSGLEVGDIILKVNRRTVSSVTDVIKRIRRGKNKLILFGKEGRKIVSVQSE